VLHRSPSNEVYRLVEEEAMLQRIIGLFAVALLVFSAPAALSQLEQAQPVYTYVSQFQVPRASWAQFAEDTEKTTNPIFQRLMTDGAIVGWGDFENIVHTPDGMTHGVWWSSTSLASITRVLDELRKVGPRPGQIAATKHEDYLLRSVYSHTTSVSGAGTGYLRVVCLLTQPGKSDDFTAAIKKYLGPTWEDQFKKGNAASYGMDQQYVLTGPGSMRCTVTTFPSAEAMNKWADALNSTLDKMSPEDRKGWQDALASFTVPDSRRDMLARITRSAHK
jgi:hypothetical protein